MLAPATNPAFHVPAQSAPPHCEPHTTFWTELFASVHGASPTTPHTIGAPLGVELAPQVTFDAHAFASAVSDPPLTSRVPQRRRELHVSVEGAAAAVPPRNCASSTAPFAFRNPAPCVSAS